MFPDMSKVTKTKTVQRERQVAEEPKGQPRLSKFLWEH